MLSACTTGPAEESSAPTESSTTTSTVTTTTTTTAAPIPTVGYCVADPSMHVRSGPGPYEEVIGGLAWGEQVSIVGKEGDWYRIQFKDDVAYVSAHYIRDTPPVSTTASETDTTTADVSSTDTTAQ